MLVEAFVGWLVQEIGSAGVRAGRRALFGTDDERLLRRALASAVETVARGASDDARESLESALRERFAAPPATTELDPALDLGAGLRQAFLAQLAPLADPEVTGTGASFLDEIGVPAGPLAAEIADAFFANLRRLAAGSDAATLAMLHELEDVRSGLRTIHRSLQPVPATAIDSLPRDTTDFTDREDALTPILECTGPAGGVLPVITVSGMAGVGKTALAVHAAHRVAADYPDLRLYLNLHAHTTDRAPVPAEAALEALLRTLGLPPQQIPDTLDERAALWRSRLNGKRALVLFDNVASPSQVRPLLPGSAECLVIVTSRRRLVELEGSQPVSLDVLPADKAVQLFRSIMGAARPGDRPGDLDRAVAMCGRLPLAIRVVAARLRRHPSWSVRDLLTELTATRDRLARIGEGEPDVLATFELSYRALPADQQRMFRRVGLHPGQDLGVHAAAALDSTDVATARRVLDELHNQHLVDERGYARYVQHDLLHEYARKLADEEDAPADRDAALDRLIGYYTTVAVRADRLINLLGHRDRGDPHGPEPDTPPITSHAEAIAWAETERPNLHACLEIALDTGRREQAVRLACAMAYFLRLSGYRTEANEMYGRIAGVCDAIGDRESAAYMRFLRGDILRLAGHRDQALDWYGRALTAYQETGNRHQEARTFHSIGDLERSAGRFADAVARYESALTAYREEGNAHAEARAWHSIADTYRMAGRLDEALIAYERLLDAYDELGDDPVGRARVRYGMADVYRAAGRYDEALTVCRTVLDEFRELGDLEAVADVLCCLGGAHLGRGDDVDARRSLDEALATYRRLNHRSGEARARRGLADADRRAGRRDEALDQLHRALALLGALDAPEAAEVREEIARLSDRA